MAERVAWLSWELGRPLATLSRGMKKPSYKLRLDGLSMTHPAGTDEIVMIHVRRSHNEHGTCHGDERWLSAMAVASIAPSWFVIDDDKLCRVIHTYQRDGVQWVDYELVYPDRMDPTRHRAPLARL